MQSRTGFPNSFISFYSWPLRYLSSIPLSSRHHAKTKQGSQENWLLPICQDSQKDFMLQKTAIECKNQKMVEGSLGSGFAEVHAALWQAYLLQLVALYSEDRDLSKSLHEKGLEFSSAHSSVPPSFIHLGNPEDTVGISM